MSKWERQVKSLLEIHSSYIICNVGMIETPFLDRIYDLCDQKRHLHPPYPFLCSSCWKVRKKTKWQCRGGGVSRRADDSFGLSFMAAHLNMQKQSNAMSSALVSKCRLLVCPSRHPSSKEKISYVCVFRGSRPLSLSPCCRRVLIDAVCGQVTGLGFVLVCVTALRVLAS